MTLPRVSRLDRRALLRAVAGGAGASVLAPFVPAQIAAAAPIKRFVVWWTPNGIFDPEYTPDGEGTTGEGTTGEGTTFRFRRILEPLERHRRKLLVLKGLDFATYFKSPVPNDHGPPLSHSLCAAPTVGGDKYLGGGPSIDQLIARRLDRPGSFDGLNVATFAYAPHARISYRAAGDAITAQTDHKKIFDSLFKNLAPATGGFDRLRARRKSRIDLVRAELLALRARLDADGRRKLDAHLEHLRNQELRLDALANKAASGACAPPDPSGHGAEPAYVRSGMRMADILFSALTCDLARVVTYVWGGPSSGETFPFLGVDARHHDLSHAPTPKPGSFEWEALTKIGRLQAEQLGKFLDRLDGVEEPGGGTMLDSSVVLWTTEHKTKNGTHDRRDVPFLLAGSAGRAFRTGRVLRFDRRPHNDLYTAIAHAFGFTDVQAFGDPDVATGPLPLG
jgi:hypothetical protein